MARRDRVEVPPQDGRATTAGQSRSRRRRGSVRVVLWRRVTSCGAAGLERNHFVANFERCSATHDHGEVRAGDDANEHRADVLNRCRCYADGDDWTQTSGDEAVVRGVQSMLGHKSPAQPLKYPALVSDALDDTEERQDVARATGASHGIRCVPGRFGLVARVV